MRLDLDNKYVFRKLELGEMRASHVMYATTHWRTDEDTTTVGTTTLNRVALGHRIEEQNRVLFEHLLTTRPGVVTNAALRERSRRLDEKRKTMTRFRPQASYPAPPLPRAFPLGEGLDDERHRVRLPPLPSSLPEPDLNAARERGWNAVTPRDVRQSALRRDDRLRGVSVAIKNAADSRTFDPTKWCNREDSHCGTHDNAFSTTMQNSARSSRR
jgi:hypothetical protein